MPVIPGDCLRNSYKIAENITDITIAEGFLITYFEDESDIESVGHVWNEYKGAYFDKSIELIQHNRNIKENKYFLRKTYDVSEASIKKGYFPTTNMYDLHPKEDPTKFEIFF
ncbi:hypothetical protein [[Flexibacter] sp. ATCC 35103]|uniref:hypothetical protein n=1 Tax=[Flexibacter] sp. ATCC 35103 TaxID=1937528 RepID=UPI0009D28D32|nr:hypothetical protein [[Flexibacter] sp. ATCC 35103]OMQ11877.1 hypothetical protein BXU01_10195 [[Flexibacter] sp. ATCC 35103]